MKKVLVLLLAACAVCVFAHGRLVANEEHSVGTQMSSDGELGNFWQMTDMHIDFNYVVGSSPYCDKTLCCHTFNSSDPRKAAPFGDYQCDLTEVMFRSALEFAASQSPKVESIMWTGDNPSHWLWEQNEEIVLGIIKNVTDLFHEYFPNTPIYPLIGNHDTFPVDELAPPPQGNWLFDGLRDMWSPLLSAEAMETFVKGGYYTEMLQPGFRLVATNTQWSDPLNFWMIVNDTDPTGQIAWLQSTLSAARQAGEKVLMIGHIPQAPYTNLKSLLPPLEVCIPSYCAKYIDLAAEYQDIIVGHLFGHTHHDSFRIVRDDKNQPAGVYYIMSSLTPYKDHNPTIRRYIYNKTSFEIVDIETYWTDLGKDIEENKITWELEYNTRETYNLPDLSPSSWADLVDRFKTDDDLFQKYYLLRDSDYKKGPCTGKCKEQYLCELGTANLSSKECVPK